MARPTNCIATGCRKANKGPRFHFLCEEHRECKAKDIEAWQAAFHEKLKAEKKKKAAKKAKKK